MGGSSVQSVGIGGGKDEEGSQKSEGESIVFLKWEKVLIGVCFFTRFLHIERVGFSINRELVKDLLSFTSTKQYFYIK